MKAWFDFINNLEKHFGKETLKRWVLSLKILRYDACNLYLEAKDNFHIAWFEEQIRPLLKNQFVNNNYHPIKVHLTLPESADNNDKNKRTSKPVEKKLNFSHDDLNEHFLFSSFIVSENNQLAYKLLSEISSQEKSTVSLGNFNPIFLYGKESSGKTHLLQATAKALTEMGHNAYYVKAQTFSQHVIWAMREGQMESFRKLYRSVDILLIDDIHYFARKNATQEEFFHTFNTLHTQGKQIVISASAAPITLKDIEARLISRFEWGISLPIDVLDKIEMKKLLLEKGSSHNIAPFKEEIYSYLLVEFGSSTSHLLKAFETLAFKIHLQQLPPSPSLKEVEIILSSLSKEMEKQALTPERIIQSVADYFGIRPEDISGSSRSREFSLPRQIVMYFCRNRLQMPFQKIGRTLNRDHSTVMTSVKQVQNQIERKDKELFLAYLEISKKIQ